MKDARYRVQWARTAENDLDEIIHFIAADSSANARAVLQRLRAAANGLNELPLRGRRPPELEDLGMTQYRELICKPWRIIYRTEERRVLVLAVLDGRRQLEDILLERLIRD